MKNRISKIFSLVILVLSFCLYNVYSFAQTGSGMANAIYTNPLFSGGVFTDTKSNAVSQGFGNNYNSSFPHGQGSDDIWYKFTLSSSATVPVSLCNSDGLDTYLHLLNSAGTEIAYNDDRGPSCPDSYMSSLQESLPAGTYYVVVEGYSNNSGLITTQITIPQNSINLEPPINSVSVWQARTAIGTVASLKAAEDNNATVNIVNKFIHGTGHTVQEVQKGASPGGNDIIQPYEIDLMGRQTKQYLPYTFSSSSSGEFRPYATLHEQASFYGNTSNSKIASTAYPFTSTAFEVSPLQRPVEQGSVGSQGQLSGSGVTGSGHTVNYDYTANNRIAITDLNNTRLAVLYNVHIDANGNYTLVNNLVGSDIYYNVNKLYVKITKDANWTTSDGRTRTKEVYTNMQGQVVLKRTFNKNSSGNIEVLSTYYVYDDFGNLCYTLPPGASPDNPVNISGSVISQDILDKLCYQYRYDAKGRQIAVKKPGVDWQYSVYNSLNQVVAIQDGNDRLRKEWFISKYDGLGRLIIKGVWNNNNTAISRNDLQNLVDQQAKLWEEKMATGNGYTAVAWPQTIARYNLINYYDDYIIPGIPSGYTYHTYAGNPEGNSKQTADKLTAIKTWLADGTTELWSVFFYEENGRIIQSQLGHHLSGKDIINTEYLFSGQVNKISRTHSSSTGSLTVVNRYDYDHHGREINLYSKIGSDDEVLLKQTVYNELGQVVDIRLHQKSGTSNFLQSLDYRYNENGSLISINDPDLLVSSASNDGDSNSDPDLFGLKLSYHDDPIAPQYNGNIAAMRWKTSHIPSIQAVAPPKMGYLYRYDALNRLTSAISEKNGTVDNAHNEVLTYDRNGNITTLKRNAFTGGGVQEIDNLVYFYDGYRSKKIDDLSIAANKALGYEDKQKLPDEHLYDLNGNMITDLNKGTTIIYNEHNLVQKVVFGTNQNLEFLYDRTGRKLQSRYTKDATVHTIDYVGGIQYDQGQIAFVQTHEGRARKTGTSYSYEYDITDHLGNARVTFTADITDPDHPVAKVIQQNSYYPYGLVMYGDAVNNLHLSYVSGEKNKYLYSGKELYDQGGLNWYDHGSRMYDPALGRWSVTDPASQFVNPYLAMGNNPVIGVDPNGKIWHIVIGAAVGGTFNLVDKLVSGQATDFGSGLKAFGVGAFAGGLGAATGGAAVAGMSVTSVSTAFLAGSVGSVYGDMALGMGNMMAFGDVYDPSPARLGTAALVGGITGGLLQGVSNSLTGRNFWTGKFTNNLGWAQAMEPTPYGIKTDDGTIIPFDDSVTPANPVAGNTIKNSKNVPYPKVYVEGYGDVPFPEGPYTPNNSTELRKTFKPTYKADFKEWWISQGRPWPDIPEGSVLNIHHIKPLKHGGTNAFENLVPLIQPEEHQPFTNWWRSFKE